MPRTPRTRKKGTGVSTRPAWPDRFLVELANRGAIAPTAKAVGVGRSTVYDELARNPDFKRDVEAVLEQCVEQVESTLFQMAQTPGGTTDRIFYLKSRKPDVYGDKLRQDQIDQIRRDARAEALAEVQEELDRLPVAARKIVMAAMAAVTKKELTP